MSDELADWLRLREAADWHARSPRLAAAAGTASRGAPGTALEVLDLGTGAESNLRYLAPRLAVAHQRWTVVDRSDVLLRQLVARTIAWAAAEGWTGQATADGCLITGADVRWEVRTLARDLDSPDTSLVEGRQLVTASALLDLVSDAWLETVARLCRASHAAVLFALTYDGRFTCTPPDAEDEAVRTHFNRHQRTDKGLGGPAAGSDATASAIARFVAAGFRVETAQTDWAIGAEAPALQRALVEGWAGAATDMAPELAAPIAAWAARRLAHVEGGRIAPAGRPPRPAGGAALIVAGNPSSGPGFDSAAVRRYYNRSTRDFLALGQGGGDGGSIARCGGQASSTGGRRSTTSTTGSRRWCRGRHQTRRHHTSSTSGAGSAAASSPSPRACRCAERA